jgi:nitrate/TMAO reductase-like tetraheme cytochrome c subunit
MRAIERAVVDRAGTRQGTLLMYQSNATTARKHLWPLTVIVTLALVCLVTLSQGRASDEPDGAAHGRLYAVAAPSTTTTNESSQVAQNADKAHAEIMRQDRFPSATTCADCHPKHYKQWSVSQHAYSQMSPVFNAMNAKILKLSNGTNGDFCIRCHTPVGMNLGEKQFMSNIDRHPTSREGVTCIVCHRVNQSYGKVSGRLAIVQGPLTDPIFGPVGNSAELEQAVQTGGLVTKADAAGRKVHAKVEKFFQLNTSGHCGTCHDVTLVNGFRLEEAFSEFKNSPAARKGISCQDCHMGKEPGRVLAQRDDPQFIAKNYDFGPAAKVGSLETAPRKLTNHMFVGPDYSVLPPSLFPLDSRAIKEESQKDDPTARGMATIREWLEFDWKAGWGTDEFEDDVADDFEFPDRWDSIDDRYDAREIIEDNLTLLKQMEQHRLTLLRNGYVLGEIITDRADSKGISFRVQVKNATDGHNVPTGFDAERLVWLYVRVLDRDGKVIYTRRMCITTNYRWTSSYFHYSHAF